MTNKSKLKKANKLRRQRRTRANIFGTAVKPRLNVSKSLCHLYLQLIDDNSRKTVLGLHSKALKKSGKKTEIAFALGEALAKKALEKGITTCIFDRGPSIYHGRVKAAAEGARQGGLKF
jgi:large subunit ribosomal protein L18